MNIMSKNRRDAKLIKQDNGIFNLIYYLKPKRAYAEVYINKKFDVTNLVKYMEKLKEEDSSYTYFHLFTTAISKLVYARPYLNRFIIAGRMYEREEVTLSFVVKTTFNDSAEELMTVIPVSKEDNLAMVKDKILSSVNKMRSNNSHDRTNDTINKVGKLPRFLKFIIMKIFKFMDSHDMLPDSLTKDDIYHASVLVSNLGSIKCGAIYHNLTDFGTNSLIITIGDIHKEVIVNDKGKSEIRDICEFGITIDERIADGFYLASSAIMLQEYFDNPEILKEKIYEKCTR